MNPSNNKTVAKPAARARTDPFLSNNRWITIARTRQSAAITGTTYRTDRTLVITARPMKARDTIEISLIGWVKFCFRQKSAANGAIKRKIPDAEVTLSRYGISKYGREARYFDPSQSTTSS